MSNRIPWVIFLLVTYEVFGMQPEPAIVARFGLGYGDRGVAGTALELYGGILRRGPVSILRVDLAFDVPYFGQSGNLYAIRATSIQWSMMPIQEVPLSIHSLVNIERYASAEATVYSFLPSISWDLGHWDLHLGLNLRNLRMDGEGSEVLFSHLEKHLAFRLGRRIDLSNGLDLGLAVGNFDMYSVGGSASVAYWADLEWQWRHSALKGEWVFRPVGSVALSAAPQAWTARLVYQRRMRIHVKE